MPVPYISCDRSYISWAKGENKCLLPDKRAETISKDKRQADRMPSLKVIHTDNFSKPEHIHIFIEQSSDQTDNVACQLSSFYSNSFMSKTEEVDRN